jgi:hypothetical protein
VYPPRAFRHTLDLWGEGRLDKSGQRRLDTNLLRLLTLKRYAQISQLKKPDSKHLTTDSFRHPGTKRLIIDSSDRTDNRVGATKRDMMATNKSTGDNARKGAVKKRSQLKSSLAGQKAFTKRSKVSERFVEQKRAPAKRRPYGEVSGRWHRN